MPDVDHRGELRAVVAGPGADQVLVSRLSALPVTIFSGRPCGPWRDAIVRRLAPAGAGALRTGVADTLAFRSFQLPIYLATLWLAGASVDQAALAASAALVVLLVSARPYGSLLDLVRRAVGADRPWRRSRRSLVT